MLLRASSDECGNAYVFVSCVPVNCASHTSKHVCVCVCVFVCVNCITCLQRERERGVYFMYVF